VARQTDTGSRYDASDDHESGTAAKPVVPCVKTVPEKSSMSGISPSPSAWRYLAAATSKSYVHSTGRSNSVAPSKPPSVVETCVQAKGRNELPHCGVSPKSS